MALPSRLSQGPELEDLVPATPMSSLPGTPGLPETSGGWVAFVCGSFVH